MSILSVVGVNLRPKLSPDEQWINENTDIKQAKAAKLIKQCNEMFPEFILFTFDDKYELHFQKKGEFSNRFTFDMENRSIIKDDDGEFKLRLPELQFTAPNKYEVILGNKAMLLHPISQAPQYKKQFYLTKKRQKHHIMITAFNLSDEEAGYLCVLGAWTK